MRTIITFFALVFVLSFNYTYSQNIDGGSDWSTEDEYRGAEEQVIENIKWLENNPLPEDEELRKEVGAYVLKWLMGCPYLTVDMDLKYEGPIMTDKKYEYSGKIATLFLFGKALYMLEHPDEKKKAMEDGSNERGIISMLTAYKVLVKEKGDKAKHKTMEKYVKLQNEGKLTEFVKSGKGI